MASSGDSTRNLDRALFGDRSPAEAAALVHRSPSDRPKTPTADRVALLAVAAIGGLGAALAPAQVTGWGAADRAWTTAFAVVLSLAASRSRRWTWVVSTSISVSITAGAVGLTCAAVALILAVGAALVDHRSRICGSLVGALVANALTRSGTPEFAVLGFVLPVLAVVPLLVSAFRASPRRVQSRWYRTVGPLLAVLLLGSATGIAAALWARGPVEDGIDHALLGLELTRSGDTETAVDEFAQARDRLGEAEARVDAWWALPARAVPLVGLQSEALRVASAEGIALAEGARLVTAEADVDALRFADGGIDVLQLLAVVAPLEEAAGSLERADERLSLLNTSWLVPPVADRIERLHSEVALALPEARLAADVVAVAPGLLGVDGPRRYLVAFTTPSESRALGGFIGSWAELSADGGHVDLIDSGRARDINNLLNEANAEIDAMASGELDIDVAEFATRFDHYRIEESIQDTTVSPDGPTVAKVLSSLYTQARGGTLDGVIIVDPVALGELMAFTGPVEIEGLDEPLNPEEAAQFLLIDQYLTFNEDRVVREDFLEAAGTAVFEALLASELPSPDAMSTVLDPMADQGRLVMWSANDAEQALFDQIGATGAMPEARGVDFVSIVSQNVGHNKLDAYLQREVRYHVTLHPSENRFDAVVEVELTNSLGDPAGYPAPVVQSLEGKYPDGTNATWLGLYTPHLLDLATVDGERVALESAVELGHRLYAARLQIPPGFTSVVRFEIHGDLPTSRFEIDWASQPLVNRDQVTITVESAEPGFTFVDSAGLLSSDFRSARFEGEITTDRTFWVDW